MNTLWILGNSASYQDQYRINDKTWMKMLAEELDYELKNLSKNSASLSYTYDCFNNIRSQIKQGDTIIITLQDTNRRWVFRDNPEETIWTVINRKKWLFPIIDPNVENAINHYLTHLDIQDIHDTYFINFMYNLHNFTKKHNIHTILIPTFEGIYNLLSLNKHNFPLFHTTDKPTIQVSQEEFMNRELAKSGIMKYINDIRSNHLTRSNHTIMKNKLVNNIKNKEPIQFKNGFLKEFLCCYTLQDKDFSKRELFNVHTEQKYQDFLDYLNQKGVEPDNPNN